MKRVAVVLLTLTLLVTGVSMSYAQEGGIDITEYEGSCESVTFSYTADSSGGFDEAFVTITNDQKEVLFDSGGFSPFGYGSPYTVTFPPQPGGTTLFLTVSTVSSDSVSWECVADVVVEIVEVGGSAPGGFCWAAGVTPVAIFEKDGVLTFYNMISRTKGVFALSISQEDLADLPEFPAEHLLVKSSGIINFYKLTSGEYQINIGPVPNENKVFVCILDNIPPTRIQRYSFYVNQ